MLEVILNLCINNLSAVSQFKCFFNSVLVRLKYLGILLTEKEIEVVPGKGLAVSRIIHMDEIISQLSFSYLSVP